MKIFKANCWMKLLLLPLVFSLSGCIYLVVGSVGAVGGYIVSPDTVEGLVDFSDREVWDSAVEIFEIMGIITERSDDSGIMLGQVSGAKVTITVVFVDDDKTKLTVKARKAFMPKISIAQDIFVKIVNNIQ